MRDEFEHSPPLSPLSDGFVISERASNRLFTDLFVGSEENTNDRRHVVTIMSTKQMREEVNMVAWIPR